MVPALILLASSAFESGRSADGREPRWTGPAMIAAYALILVGGLVELLYRYAELSLLLSVLGAVLLAVGYFLGQWAVAMDHRRARQFVTNGPYSYCRHPDSLAIVLEMIGFCLIPNAVLTLALALPIYLIVMMARIRAQEDALLAQYGDEYRAYMEQTWSVVPLSNFWWR